MSMFREKISALRKKLKWADPFTYVDLLILPRLHKLSEQKQTAVFVASYLALAALVYIIIGVTGFFMVALTVFYAYLFLFERKEALDWGIYMLSAFLFAWFIYSSFGFLLGTSSPLVIVVSGSMEPVYHRGDVIILQAANFESTQGPEVQLNEPINGKPFAAFAKPVYGNGPNGKVIEKIEFNDGQTIPITTEGSIVVYSSQNLFNVQGPIIHRIAAKINAADGTYFLTKGDSVNNTTLDQDCGNVVYGRPEKPCIMRYPIKEEELQGKALFQIPAIGCVKLWLFDNFSSIASTGSLPKDFRTLC